MNIAVAENNRRGTDVTANATAAEVDLTTDCHERPSGQENPAATLGADVQQVLRLEVPMHDAQRMQVGDRLQDLLDAPGRVVLTAAVQVHACGCRCMKYERRRRSVEVLYVQC